MIPLTVVILLWMVASGLIGYLLGSFPTAYLIVKWKSHIDIRTAGSGNVGGLNSYVVTKSKAIGVVVALIDIAKGVGAVLLAGEIVGMGFVYLAAAGIGAVLGHNFPVWLRFKGGRGLATSAGVLLVLSWQLLVVWVVFWGVGFLITRAVNIANAIASVLALLFVIVAPSAFLRQIILTDATATHFKYFSVLLVGLILIRLIEPILDYAKERKEKRGKKEDITDAGS